MLNTSQSYAQIMKDLPRSLGNVATKPQVKREIDYYLANVGKVKTAADLVNNTRLFNFAMKAFGMEDLSYAKALVRKALVEGIDNNTDIANRMADPRLREFVSAFNFQRRGEYTTTFQETQKGAVDRYIRQTLEETAGLQNEGVRLALYFERKAPQISDAYSILADKNLLKIVQTALDIPAASSAQDIDKQAALIGSKLKISDLSDPGKLRSFLNRFTVKWELANPTATPTQQVANVQLGFASAPTLSADVLTAIQTLITRR